MDQKQLALIAVFAVGAWVAWLIFSTVRQYMAARMQAATQDKLLLRLSSPESLQVFLASEAGVRFLRALEADPMEAMHGIIRNVQTSVIFGVAGVAMLISHLMYPHIAGLLPFGLGGLAAAIAFGLAAAVSLTMYRRAGMLPRGRN